MELQIIERPEHDQVDGAAILRGLCRLRHILVGIRIATSVGHLIFLLGRGSIQVAFPVAIIVSKGPGRETTGAARACDVIVVWADASKVLCFVTDGRREGLPVIVVDLYGLFFVIELHPHLVKAVFDQGAR